MQVLFIHQNFPGQFRHLASQLVSSKKNRVLAICQPQAPGLREPLFNPVVKAVYRPHRRPSPQSHPYLSKPESHVLNGQAVARLLLDLKKKGFEPDIAFAHIGWGEAIYFKDVFPRVPLVGYCEFYYHGHGVDLGFDPEYPCRYDDRLRVRTLNAAQLLTLPSIDSGVSPTHWQRSLYPPEFQPKIRVIHEGIDTNLVRPDPTENLDTPQGTKLTKEMEVITYTARGLEPYRGIHIFMRAAKEILSRRSHCHIVVTGGDEVRYGKKLPPGMSHREKFLKETPLDSSRLHFMGLVPYRTHLKTLRVSSAHVYLTVPFVLSWSVLEAMAAEAVVIGSATPPVQEIIENNRNGLLVDFFSPIGIADLVDEILDHPQRMSHLGEAARRHVVAGYEVRQSLRAYESLCLSLLSPSTSP